MTVSATARIFSKAPLGVLCPYSSLRFERRGDDRDRQRPHVLGHLGHVRSGTGPGASAHSGGNENDIRAVKDLPQFFLCLLGRLFPDLGKRACPQSPGCPASQKISCAGT